MRVVLRSLDGGPHVDEIGTKYGGCGHPRHAFFSVPLDMWEDIWEPPQLVLWDVPSSGSSCLELSRGDLVIIAVRSQLFREAPSDEWSWGLRHSKERGIAEEGWVPTLAHTLFLSTKNTPSASADIAGLAEGDLLVAWAQRGDYLWGSRCDSSLAAAVEGPKAWFLRDAENLLPVHPRSVRELLSAACSSGAQGGA